MNSRPITYQSTDSDNIPLTPSQLPWGRDLTFMPPLLQSDAFSEANYEAKAARHQYELISQALDRFCQRWSSEYLATLREKHVNNCAERPTHHLKPRSLVMLQQDNLHHIEWPLSVVRRVFPDKQGVVTTVEVEEGDQRSTRPVADLVPLELDCDEAEAVNPTEERDNSREGEAVDFNPHVEVLSYFNPEAEVPSDFNLEAATEQLQSPVPSDEENGDVENVSAGQPPAPELLSHPTNTEGDSLQHRGTPIRLAQTPRSELAANDDGPTDSPAHETFQSGAHTRPQ